MSFLPSVTMVLAWFPWVGPGRWKKGWCDPGLLVSLVPSRPKHDSPGSTLVRPRIDPGSTLVRPLFDPGSTLVRPWIDPGSTVGRPCLDLRFPGGSPSRAWSGPVPPSFDLGRCGVEHTSILGSTLARSRVILERHWFDPGSTLPQSPLLACKLEVPYCFFWST